MNSLKWKEFLLQSLRKRCPNCSDVMHRDICIIRTQAIFQSSILLFSTDARLRAPNAYVVAFAFVKERRLVRGIMYLKQVESKYTQVLHHLSACWQAIFIFSTNAQINCSANAYADLAPPKRLRKGEEL